jgi:hypothetical protein
MKIQVLILALVINLLSLKSFAENNEAGSYNVKKQDVLNFFDHVSEDKEKAAQIEKEKQFYKENKNKIDEIKKEKKVELNNVFFVSVAYGPNGKTALSHMNSVYRAEADNGFSLGVMYQRKIGSRIWSLISVQSNTEIGLGAGLELDPLDIVSLTGGYGPSGKLNTRTDGDMALISSTKSLILGFQVQRKVTDRLILFISIKSNSEIGVGGGYEF